MRVMIVDDEPLALHYLQKLLLSFDRIEIAGTFTEVEEAIGQIGRLKPDVVFLDVQMPEINGIAAAEMMTAIHGEAKIVMVTAYDEYAIQAFDVNASDYLLKPVNPDRLEKTLTRLRGDSPAEDAPKAVIRCFGPIRIGQVTPEWRTAKAQELFALLIHHRNLHVPKEHIADLLWPHLEARKSLEVLYSTIYLVRKTIKALDVPIMITSKNESYGIELNGTAVDIDLWEQAVKSLPPLSEDTYRSYVDILDQYTVDYLLHYEYVWVEAERMRLRLLWYSIAGKTGDFLFENGHYTEALAVYNRMLAFEPLDEAIHWQIMKAFDSMNNGSAVKQHYDKFAQLIDEELGIEPQDEIQEWINTRRLDFGT